MAADTQQLEGPDLALGVKLSVLADGGMLLGHVGDEAVLLARRGDELFAIGATCTHYGGPLAEGLLVDDTVRCRWHHACFSLRTGEALRAPALEPGACWRVEQRDGTRLSCARSSSRRQRRKLAPAAGMPASGRDRRRRRGGQRRRRDAAPRGLRRAASRCSAPTTPLPYDRPNLSKDYLAGHGARGLDPAAPGRVLRRAAASTCGSARASPRSTRPAAALQLADGSQHALRRAAARDRRRAGAPRIPGADLPHVHYLRTLADSRAHHRRGAKARERAVVIGASFIGLEVAGVAARARARGARRRAARRVRSSACSGAELGDVRQALHEEHGVRLPSRHDAPPRSTRGASR